MSIEPSAKHVPDVAWEYWGWFETMQDVGALYGLDARRAECHVRLCEHYGLERDATAEITDHMDKLENACQLHDALVELQEQLND